VVMDTEFWWRVSQRHEFVSVGVPLARQQRATRIEDDQAHVQDLRRESESVRSFASSCGTGANQCSMRREGGAEWDGGG
jgi:hypothetical protein